MTAWSVGQLITMARLNDKIFGVLGLADRQSAGTATAAVEQAYLRLDSVPIIGGEMYFIEISPFIFDSTVAGDLMECRIRINTAGNATTASTQLGTISTDSKTGSGSQRTKGGTFQYTAAANGNLSILLSYIRTGGTGNVRINASATNPCKITVRRGGTAPSDTGVDL